MEGLIMKIKLYGSSTASTRKARRWFEEQEIDFEYRDIIRKPLKKKEMQSILRLTEEGTKDIIATRSNVYKELEIDFESLSMNELYVLLNEHPRLLRQPIIVGGNKLQVGFDEYNIRQFISREERKRFLDDSLAFV